MVEITIYIEGGTLPSPKDKIQAKTAGSNNAVFRKGFNKLFSQVFNQKDFNLIVLEGGPNKQTVKFFQQAINNGKEVITLLDLDAPKSQRTKRLTDFGLMAQRQQVFFMIQEMEAWILAQPEVIDKFIEVESLVRNKKRVNEVIVENTLIHNKTVEQIEKPSQVLKTLFTQYVRKLKRNKQKKRNYRKSKDGPALIELLDFQKLQTTFLDVDNLIQYINSKK